MTKWTVTRILDTGKWFEVEGLAEPPEGVKYNWFFKWCLEPQQFRAVRQRPNEINAFIEKGGTVQTVCLTPRKGGR